MNSVREGRKVLFSIKVSTLLTIILTIVVTIAKCNLILEKKVEEEKQLSEEVLQEVAIGTNKIAVETMNEQSEIKEHFHESARSIDRKELDALLNPTTKIEDIVISKDMDLNLRKYCLLHKKHLPVFSLKRLYKNGLRLSLNGSLLNNLNVLACRTGLR